MNVVTRLLLKAEVKDDCIVYTGHLLKGYGKIYYNGKNWLVHRLAYSIWVGELDPKMTIDHVYNKGCRNKHCFKPEHLEQVSIKENSRRRSALVQYCPQGHEYTQENIRRTPAGGRYCNQCNIERAKTRRESMGMIPRKQSYCRKGHLWTVESTGFFKNGGRFCKICKQISRKPNC